MSSGSRLTVRRAIDIQRGYGASPSAEELNEFKAWEAKFKGEIAPVMKRIARELGPAVKAYPQALRVINAAPKAERRRLENLPIVVVARMGTPRPTRPSSNGGVARSSRSRSTRRARAPAGRKSDDDPHELTAALAALIDEHGARSASRLACDVGRRKADVLRALHAGPFLQIGCGRSARWLHSFDATEAAELWKCSPEMAVEIIFGREGFLERGFVQSLNGNGRVLVTERGLMAAATVEAVR